ncbi:hypothetical protein ACIQZB_00420 [Streptomyces sp. NPDC097727]|uniref:hypothetical protein n=1 Tax=Streptomyces sp. NPDC097727 TaxID=3366092 RepID=UPI00382D55A6
MTLHEYPGAGPYGPTFHVFLDGWRYGRTYETHASAMRAAKRASNIPSATAKP